VNISQDRGGRFYRESGNRKFTNGAHGHGARYTGIKYPEAGACIKVELAIKTRAIRMHRHPPKWIQSGTG